MTPDRRALCAGLAGVFATAGAAPSAFAQPSAASIVGRADEYRFLGEAVTTRLRITDQSGSKRRKYSYSAVIGGDLGAVVTSLDGDQRGQKFLSNASGFWFYAPRTRRAIRLTPLQIIRGQASVGDVSRLSFADDYVAGFAPERSQVVDGRDCWAMLLRARSSRSTYATVSLLVDKADYTPKRATFMAASGRALKSAIYSPPASLAGRRVITAVTYVDAINTKKRTLVETLSAESISVRPAMFRPEALALSS